MALETTATIRGRDETGAAFDSIKKHVEALDKQLAGINKTIAAVGAVDGRSGGLINALGRADRAVKQVSATSAGLRGEFDRLNAAQAKLGAFRGMTEGFARARQSFNAARADVERLGREMNKAEAPTAKLSAEYKKAQAAVEAASRTFETQKTAMVGLKTEIEELSGPLRSLSSAEARIASDVERVTSALRAQGVAATRTAEELAAAARREEQGAQRRANRREALTTMGAFAGIAVAHAVEHGATDVVEVYRDFDKERRYGKAVMGISDEEQIPLVEQAIHGGSTTKFNDIQFLEAQRELAARGLNIHQILGMIPAGANLGMATDQDLPSSVRQLEFGIFGFKKDTSSRDAAVASAKQTADRMVKASKISGMTPEDEVQLYKRGANPAHLAGVGEESLLAFGGTLKRANIGGDEASTAFRALIAAGLNPTAGAKTALLAHGLNYKNYQHSADHLDVAPFVEDIAAKYGVKLNEHAQAALGKVFGDKNTIADPAKFTPAVMKVLGDALGGADAKSKKSIAGEANRYRAASATGLDFNAFMTDIMKEISGPGGLALSNALFGPKQGGRIATAFADPETFTKMVDAIKNQSEGYAPEIAKERMAGFDGALSELEGALKNVATSIGRAWDADGKGGALTDIAKFAGSLAQHFAELDARVVQTASGIAAVAAAIAGAWGSFKVAQMLFGFGGGGAGMAVAATALDGSAVALDGSAAALSAAAARLGVGGLPSGAPRPPTAVTSGATGYSAWKVGQQASPIEGFWARTLGSAGEVIGKLAGPLGAILWLRDLGEAINPTTPQGAPYRTDTKWATQREDFERATRAEKDLHQGEDMEAHRGRALHDLGPQHISVDGHAELEVPVRVMVEASAELRAVVADMRSLRASIPLSGPSGGRMDSDAAPRRTGMG